jgi:hypothetical protein
VPERHVAKYPIESVQVASNPYPPTDMPRVAWSSYAELRNWGDIADLDLAHTEPYSHGYVPTPHNELAGAAIATQNDRKQCDWNPHSLILRISPYTVGNDNALTEQVQPKEQLARARRGISRSDGSGTPAALLCFGHLHG